MGLLLYAFALAASSAPFTEVHRNWGAALAIDAKALHDDVAANHPGPVNPADPGFEARNDAQLALALRRAKRANSYADYFYAMQEYLASFNDGHLDYGVSGATPDDVRRWPGFLTRYEGNDHQIVFVSESWSGVPLGARLVSCDGLTADRLARKRVGSRFGRWDLSSQRILFGALTFLDAGDPYVGSVHRCRFTVGGKSSSVTLRWRAADSNLYKRYQLFPQNHRALAEWRRLANGIEWLSLPSFDGNPDGATGKSLRSLLNYLETAGAEVRAAPGIVLDLRGNGGGSSDWSFQIAKALWGQGDINRHPERPMTISWRASAGNLDSIRKSYQERSAGGHLSPEMDAFYRETIAGLAKAIAERKSLWIVTPPSGADEPALRRDEADNRLLYHLRGPVFVLTDSFCMSACLDAVDLWTRLGAIPIGRETGADTLYMEVRQIPLPAGLGAVSIPMKVYSGRARGSNEPVLPRHRFDGDIGNTRLIERWVATLPELRTDQGEWHRAPPFQTTAASHR